MVPMEEGGSDRSVSRSVQVNYYIGLACEALRNKAKAREFFTLSAEQSIEVPSYLSYYKGLSNQKLGKSREADEIFKALVDDGNKRIGESTAEVDAFAKFGDAETMNTRISQGYLMRGIGYKGMGEKNLAKTDLTRAVELSAGNLWAKTFLQN
jgi:tetratricopeptide (TPR) repeat protein